ncbi:gliding motility-associated-like protein [Flavobacterium sp. CG_9.10]|uniref:HYR-like domain-containing protein n=1 Tax=Flavobacterium sp. CG_9.10 TaxID=2787729 RepID=UPI0018C99D5A|nr:gliding motility-associated C-terminal domain-containing protein [Flavobacterium sp. CG_9.10]MBG6112182.1 gliding motility-associated-like protein [Flavobacterium sp. CG_9.10]
MKSTFTISTKLFYYFLVTFLSFSSGILAQTIGPGIAPVNTPSGGFSIDGTLKADTNTGDWVDGTGTGGFVLANSGAPLISGTTYHLFDPYNTSGDNIFGGGDKVGDNPNSWSWVTGTANDKTDMNNALIHLTTDVKGNVWVIFAADRLSNSGNAYVDFEFLQTAMTKTATGFQTLAPASTGGRTEGDFLLTVYFESGVAKFDIQRWEFNGSVWGYKTYFASLLPDSVYAAGNSTNVPVPFQAFGVNNYLENTFIESAVNLSAVLGKIDPCSSLIIKTVFVKSKTSISSSAAIKDFFEPLPIDNLTLGSADAGDDDTTCAGSSYMLQGVAIPSDGYTIISKTWTLISGSATITDSNDLHSLVNITGSSATFRLTVVTGPIVGSGAQCTVSDDVVITVNQPLTCSINGPNGPLCPSSSSNSYSAPVSATYAWSISGNGTIVGSTNSQSVTVTAGANCNETFTLSLTITGTNGCTSICTKTVNVLDDTKPTVTAPSTTDLECATDLPAAVTTIANFNALGGAAASDNCSNTANLVVTASTGLLIGTTCSGSITRTYTITDPCGNATSVSQVFTVTDNTKPTVTAPSTTDLECASDLPAAVTTIANFNALGGAAASDNCSTIANLVVTSSTGSLVGTTCSGSITRTYTITDSCGNATSVSQVFTVTDNTKLTVTAPSTTDLECASDLPAAVTTITNFNALGGAAASDNCSTTANLVVTSSTGSLVGTTCSGSITRTYTITDSCGNATSVSQVFTVTDNTKPTVTAPSTTDLECASDLPAAVTIIANFNALGGAAASDNCSNTANLVVTSSTGSLVGTTCSGSITRTYTITDSCGNATSVSQVFTITDNTKPTVTAPSTTDLECASDLPAAVTTIANFNALGGAAASDNCSTTANLVVTSSTGSFVGTTCSGSITRTYTITDSCGNATSVSQVFTVTDNTKPTVTAPSTTDLECASDLPAAVTTIANFNALGGAAASDNCSNTANLVVTSSTGSLVGTTCSGSITRTYTITDSCGNATSVNQVFTITDNTKPTVTAPSTTDLECATDLPAAVTTIANFNALGGATASDNCSTTANLVVTSSTGSLVGTACSGSITRTYTITDACGNATSVSQVFTVTDNTKPTVTAPSTTELECASDLPAAVTTIANFNALGGAAASDNCSTTANLVVTSSTGSLVGTTCSGSITRTYTITDACGNATSVSQVFTVTDNTKPTVTAPSTTDLECASDLPAAVTTIANFNALGGAAASDNCSNTANLVVTSSTGSLVGTTCSGSITRIYTITDSCGNATSVNQVFTVTDNTKPTVTTPSTTDLECASDLPAAVTTIANFNALGGAAASDNCSSTANLVVTSSTGSLVGTTCSGSITRTYTITDSCGNATSVSQVFTVTDNTKPVISTNASNKTVECDGIGNDAALQTWLNNHGGAAANDACSTISWSNNFSALSNGCGATGNASVTFIATDQCGNASQTTAVFTIEDKTPPTFTAPANIILSSDKNCFTDLSTASTGTVTNIKDNCDSNPTATYTDGDCFGESDNQSINAGVGNYFPFTVSGFDGVLASAIEKVALAFETNQGKGRAEFTLVSPNGQAVILVGPYCTGGACDDATSNTKELYLPVFYPNSSGYPQWNNNNFVQDGVSQNFIPNGGTTSPNTISGITSYVSSFENLTGPMNGNWFIYSRKQASVNGSIDFKSVCLRPAVLCTNNKIIVRHWSVSDACSNAVKFDQIIQVIDTIKPTWITAENSLNVTVECSDVNGLATAQALFPIATDNCDSDVKDIQKVCGIFKPSEGCTNAGTYTNTWIVVDECGNTSSIFTQIITIQDTTPPTINTAASNTTVECNGDGNQNLIGDWLANNGGATASDTCSNVTWSNNFNALSNDCSAAVTVIFTAKDGCGNTASSSATFTVVDKTKPVAPQAPADVTVSCSTNVPVMPSLTAIDNCAGQITTAGIDVISERLCANSYVITRTWTFTDACSNSSSSVQTITVQDINAPVITELPAATTISCPATPEFTQATASDECGSAFELNFIDVSTNGACTGSYSVTRTWTAKDACGNSSTSSQTINVQDVTAPVIAALPTASTISCPVAPEFTQATATDECGSAFELTHIDTTVDGACTGSYSVTRTWTAKDACGNSSTSSQTINVQDVTAPVIAALPTASTISCPASPEFTQATATDECGSAFELNFIDVSTNGACAGTYSVTRTWTAKDDCGNTSTASQTINVQDVTGPVIAQLPTASTISCPATPEFAQATATDECGSAFELNFIDVSNNGACAGSYSVTRTWTAKDACGNTSTASQTINVQDVTGPVIVQLPTASTISCPATPEFAQATATDECGSAFELNFIDVSTNGACAGSYSVTRTWTAKDACGNSSTSSQTINVQDVTAPVIANLPSATTISCSATPEFTQAIATDECGSAFELTHVDTTVNGACAGSYSVTRTWTAKDACGNSSTSSQTINVQDTVAPVIAALPAASTISCSATPEFVQATAIDECGSEFLLTSTDAKTSGACVGSYSITRTWTAKDACGNTSTASQTINVQDLSGPVIAALPTDSTISCPATPEFAQATATDECGSDFTLTSTDAKTPGACAGTYSVTRTWTAKDACGNTSTASQTINVQDLSGPVIAQLPAALTISCPATPEFVQATAIDECGSVFELKFIDVTTNGACAGSYSVTRTWTAQDACGNTSTASQTINVQDLAGPTTATPFSSTIDVSCDAIPARPELVFVDNCSSVSPATFIENIINRTQDSYSIVRKWTVSDSCGNTSTITQIVNVSISNSLVTIPASACNNGEVTTIDLSSLLPVGTPANGSWTATNNSVTLQGSILTVFGLAKDDYVFEYKIEDANCPRSIKINMTIDESCKGIVLPCATVLVHNAFSPNGDGINENFIIDNINPTADCYPDNTVEIYNRWGVLVFETRNYNNETNNFNGISRGRTTISQSSGLPSGVYFYILNYTSKDNNGNLQTNKKDGYLYLTR